MSLSSINGSTPPAAAPVRPPLPDAPIAVRPPHPVKTKTDVHASGGGKPTDSEVDKAVAALNDFTSLVAQDVRFSVDDESGKTIVKVVDTNTQEVLRQFPSAEALSIARSIDKMQGLLIREKA